MMNEKSDALTMEFCGLQQPARQILVRYPAMNGAKGMNLDGNIRRDGQNIGRKYQGGCKMSCNEKNANSFAMQTWSSTLLAGMAGREHPTFGFAPVKHIHRPL